MGTIEDYPTFLNLSTRPITITSDFIDTTDYSRVSTFSKDRDVEKMVGKSGDKFDGCVHLQEERGSGRVGMVF